MEVRVILGSDIDNALARAWTDLQASNADLTSPYFAPEFTMAVASVRRDVEVSVIEDCGKVTAIFPFQRSRGSVGTPVGGILSDYQGLICEPKFACDARELVRKCGLLAWDFDHLLASQTCFAPFHQVQTESPLMDLSHGYEGYAMTHRATGSQLIKKCGNLTRRMEREIGPVRFVAHAADSTQLQKVLAWKSQQYLESGKQDLFALGWVRGLVEYVHCTRSSQFTGMLSLLYAGNSLVAGHIGMRSNKVLHYWFPAYDKEFAKYSPGLILLLKMAEHAPLLGLHVIDLGMGLSLYKKRLMNNSVLVAGGSVELPSWLAFRRRARKKARQLVVNSPLQGPARRLVSWAIRRSCLKNEAVSAVP